MRARSRCGGPRAVRRSVEMDDDPHAGVAADGGTELVLTPEGHARLLREYETLVHDKRPRAAARLAETLARAGDSADTAEYVDACAEADLIEQRIDLLAGRLATARVLRSGEASGSVVTLGSEVVLEDLDEGGRETYVLVSSAESSPTEGRLSNESPVGRAISGHHRKDVVEAHAPHRVRHLRIVDVHRVRG